MITPDADLMTEQEQDDAVWSIIVQELERNPEARAAWLALLEDDTAAEKSAA